MKVAFLATRRPFAFDNVPTSVVCLAQARARARYGKVMGARQRHGMVWYSNGGQKTGIAPAPNPFDAWSRVLVGCLQIEDSSQRVTFFNA
jgi:hypothetical protein